MSERMQWSEAEAIVRAYRAEQGVSDEIDIATLARALGTDVAHVRRLAATKPRFIDRSGLLSAGIAVAVAAFVFAFFGPSLATKNPLFARFMPAPTYDVVAPQAPMPPVPVASIRVGAYRPTEVPRLQIVEIHRENM